MPRKADNGPKAARECLRERMRGYGCAVPQIAAEMSRRFNLRPRAAWRYALGWQQWKVAQRYNTLYPGAKLSESRISEYEAWPHGGARPSLRYLARLATTFGNGCTPAQLVDADDLEKLIPADRLLLTTNPPPAPRNDANGLALIAPEYPGVLALPAGQPTRSNGHLVLPNLPPDPAMWANVMGLGRPDDLTHLLIACLLSLTDTEGDEFFTARGRDDAYHQVVHFLTSWASTMKRRAVLRTLGWVATAASVGHVFDLDEQARVAAVLSTPQRIDAATIEHFEAVLWRCKRLDDALGPRAALDIALAQRDVIRSLLPDCPEHLRPRLLSAQSISSRLAGWFTFDLNDFASAAYYYDDCRTAAHDAENIDLGAYVLGNMSLLVTRQGKPRLAIDHAMAAQQWAEQTGDWRLRAFCADEAARVYAAAGQRDACLAALNTARTALAASGDQPAGYLWRYSEETHYSKRGECHLALHDTERAIDYAQRSLANADPSLPRGVGLTKIDLARALAQSREVEESARLLGEAAAIASRNSSLRLVTVLKQARTDLQPWGATPAVRTLDDQFTTYGLT